MARDPTDLALAQATRIMVTDLTPVARALYAIEGLPLRVRRQVVAVVEESDLLRFYLQQAKIERVIGPPIKTKPTRAIKPLKRKRKARR